MLAIYTNCDPAVAVIYYKQAHFVSLEPKDLVNSRTIAKTPYITQYVPSNGLHLTTASAQCLHLSERFFHVAFV